MNKPWQVLSASSIKAIACVSMLLDHVGLMLLPEVIRLRIAGRLAFPLFAYCVAEGCRYTRNRSRRFWTVFAVGAACEAAYVIYNGAWYGNVLLTFSLSILLIYTWQEVKKTQRIGGGAATGAVALFVAALIAAGVLAKILQVDYGFAGVLLPVLVSLCDDMPCEGSSRGRAQSCCGRKLVLFTVGVVLVIVCSGAPRIQAWSLLAVPLMLLYNGAPGHRTWKYGFYVFYPLHLVVLSLIATIGGVGE